MSISPSDLPVMPWWGWLFCSVGTWAICIICQSFGDRDRSLVTTFAAFVSGLIAILSGAIGVIFWFRNG